MQDDVKKTFIVAGSLCLFCSILVSAAAVSLKPKQKENQQLDIQKNILEVAGIYDDSKPVNVQFDDDWRKLVGLGPRGKGEYFSKSEIGVELAEFKPEKAAKDATLGTEIAENALPQIPRRAHFGLAYEITGEDGSVQKIILPIYGKGLWSTLYGFISLEADCQTVAGITFYQHGETPGLGGEVDNKQWKASWVGKNAFGSGDFSQPTISVVKGKATGEDQIDGLSGATITSKGVSDLVKYWLGPDAYGPYLDLRRGETEPVDNSEETE